MGRLRPGALAEALQRLGPAPTVVWLQAGDLNTGVFDPFAEACAVARDAGAWVHVDGAFGLWAATSARHRHLLAGVEQADSWATDGHKWLNVPYDCGFAIVRDADAQSTAMGATSGAEYIPPNEHGERNGADWAPEFSRRARSLPESEYAAAAAFAPMRPAPGRRRRPPPLPRL